LALGDANKWAGEKIAANGEITWAYSGAFRFFYLSVGFALALLATAPELCRILNSG
jgi:hypothetical protein